MIVENNEPAKMSIIFSSKSDPSWNEEINKVGGRFKAYDCLLNYLVAKLESSSEIPEDLICIYNGIQINDLERVIINLKQQANENLNKKEVQSQIKSYLNKSKAEIIQTAYEIRNNLVDDNNPDAVLDFDNFMVAYEIVVKSAMSQIMDCLNNYPNGMINAEKYFKYDKEKI